MYIGKIFARWVYPYTNARDDTTMRCFFSGLVRLYLGKLFARWVYPYTNARDDMTRRCFFFRIGAFRALNSRFMMHLFGQKTGFRARMNEIKSGIPCSGCVCIFVNYLQDGFTKYLTMRCVFFSGLVRLYRGKIFARWVYKIQTHAMTLDDALRFFLRIRSCVSL